MRNPWNWLCTDTGPNSNDCLIDPQPCLITLCLRNPDGHGRGKSSGRMGILVPYWAQGLSVSQLSQAAKQPSDVSPLSFNYKFWAVHTSAFSLENSVPAWALSAVKEHCVIPIEEELAWSKIESSPISPKCRRLHKNILCQLHLGKLLFMCSKQQSIRFLGWG